jgi:surface antigen
MAMICASKRQALSVLALAGLLGACAAFDADQGISRDIARPRGVFQEALDRFQSGRTLSWQDQTGQTSGTVTLIRNFQLVDDRYCREYEANYVDPSQGSLAWNGVACLGGDHIWRTVDKARLR